MHVKAFGLMTRHPVKAETIPEDLRAEMPVDERGRVDRPPRELRGEIFRRFLEALEPLRAAGKLGGHPLPAAAVHRLQGSARSTTSSGRASSSAATRCSSSSATARGWTTRTARRASPSSSGSAPATSSSTPRARTRRRTSSRPWSRRPRRPPYVRFHGRNLGTWNKRGGSAAERFDYLYSDEELGEWVGPLRELARPVRAGVRLLQQQRVVGGSRQPARPRLAGGDERATATPAPRREQDRGERRNVAWPRERPLDRARRGRAAPSCSALSSPRPGTGATTGASSRAAPPPLDAYDAVLVFGGFMHPDQDDLFPWLPDETDWLRGLVEQQVPTLGICLGSELLAQSDGRLGRAAAGARDRLGRGRADGGRRRGPRLLRAAARGSRASSGTTTRTTCRRSGVALAHSAASLQAFRLGDTCWGVQFHPEVTEPQLGRWIGDESDPPPDPERLLAETRERIGGWNELGRRLCRSFLAAAERARRARRLRRLALEGELVVAAPLVPGAGVVARVVARGA